MQEGSIRHDVETWLRYITSKFSKQLLDISALQRLISLITNNPEFKDLIASLLIRHLETEVEISAIMMLHVVNIIIYNLRLSCRDNSDADFLGKILDLGLDTMDKNLRRPWKEWPNQLGRTLMEWKQNYKIENRLTKEMQKLIESKEKEDLRLRDVHFTCIECVDELAHFLRDHNTEAISVHLLRVWESSFIISEPLIEPYNKILYSDSNNEGWNDITKITHKYLSFMLASPNTASLIFRNSNADKLGIIPQVFAGMHAATFIESSVGASIRALIGLLKTMDTNAALNSPAFQRCMKEIISFFQYTVENMHSLSPFLCKYLCETCTLITKIKAQEDFWNEINGLLVLRMLAPAVSNPVLAGIVEFADMNAVQLLTYTAKIIQHAWVGKVIEHGDLSSQTWINEIIPKWKNELQHSFYVMINSKKNEPRSIALPKSLLIYDLQGLESKMKGFSWNKCPGLSTTTIVKKPEIIHEDEEIEEDIQEEDEVPVVMRKLSKGSEKMGKTEEKIAKAEEKTMKHEEKTTKHEEKIKKHDEKPQKIEEKIIKNDEKHYKHDEIEDSTPSMQSLPPVHEFLNPGRTQIIRTAPPDAFKSLNIEIIHEEPLPNPFKRKEPEVSDNPMSEKPKIDMKDFSQRSKGVQCAALFTSSQYAQTEGSQNSSKLVQTESENFICKSVQTDPEKQRMKIRSRLESTIQIMDQETITELNLNEVYEGYTLLKSKCEDLTAYKQQETMRISKINESWANQFYEVKEENARLKEKVKKLEEDLKAFTKTKEDEFTMQTLTKVYSHTKLREDLANKFFIQDENILRKCDPNYYFGLETGVQSLRTSNENFTFKEEYRSKFTEAIKTFDDFK